MHGRRSASNKQVRAALGFVGLLAITLVSAAGCSSTDSDKAAEPMASSSASSPRDCPLGDWSRNPLEAAASELASSPREAALALDSNLEILEVSKVGKRQAKVTFMRSGLSGALTVALHKRGRWVAVEGEGCGAEGLGMGVDPALCQEFADKADWESYTECWVENASAQ